MNYTTKTGDTFDLIAYQQLGSCRFTDKIIDANRNFIDTFIFSAGVELVIPDVSQERQVNLPPWRRNL